MKKKNKKIPKFKNENEEREFWQTHDTTDYFDYSKANRVKIEFDKSVEMPVKSISLRLPRELLNEIRVLAVKRDVPYQSLIKILLAQKLQEERRVV
jgi:predicted DNA binding CopG/RHH family protein